MTAPPPAPTTRKIKRPDFLIELTREPDLLELREGDVLGQFRVERRLGKGGMSSVYLARHVTGGAKVAIKVPNPELARDLDACDRLAGEGRMLAKLRHPNVVTLFDSGVAPNGLPYLVMEYLEGKTLSAREQGQMSVQPVVHVLSQLCDALGAFHAVGGVHRDVKPDNVFIVRRLDAPLTVKLLDFGIARSAGDLQRRHATAMGSVMGTPDYMAPEQMMGEAVDARADLYAVGVIGYLMLTGALPYSSIRDKMFTPPPPMRDRRPDVPVALEAVINHALAPDPAQRYASAVELREALVGALGTRKVSVAVAAVTIPAPLRSKPIAVLDQTGTPLASCGDVLVVPGGAWLCTPGAIPNCDTQVLLSVPGYEGFIQAHVVSTALFPEHVRKALPRGFLVEFSRLESGAKAALAALAPK